MDALVETTARVSKGRLTVRSWSAVSERIRHLRDGEYTVTIKRRRATRSGQANRFYWGVIVQLLAEHTGYTPDEMHEILKAKFIPKKFAVTDGNGEIRDELVIGGSSAALNTVEFGEYCEAIQQWAASELGVNIPDPNEAAA